MASITKDVAKLIAQDKQKIVIASGIDIWVGNWERSMITTTGKKVRSINNKNRVLVGLIFIILHYDLLKSSSITSKLFYTKYVKLDHYESNTAYYIYPNQ